jgi:hypothetical protein
LFCLFNSCKTVSVQNEQQQTTSNTKILGAIGMKSTSFSGTDYNTIGLPVISEPIKVNISQELFSNATYKAFQKAKEMSITGVNVLYNDSSKIKLKFLKIDIADKVSLLHALNQKDNLGIKEYLATDKEAHLITGISIVLSESETKLLLEAQEVFLQEVGQKSYALVAYSNNQEQGKILFKQGVVFAYRPSYACWQEDSKYQLQIVNLVEGQRSCSPKTYKSAKRAKKKINYFKF